MFNDFLIPSCSSCTVSIITLTPTEWFFETIKNISLKEEAIALFTLLTLTASVTYFNGMIVIRNKESLYDLFLVYIFSRIRYRFFA